MGQMAEDFGKLGDMEAAQRLLDDNYAFPPDCDEAIVDLLKEAATLQLEFDEVPPSEIDTTIEEFISFWTTSDERMGSSMSGRHFVHYKAACGEMDIVRLHVRSINLTARWGTSLK